MKNDNIVIAEPGKWYDSDKDINVKPNDGAMLIFAIWYDGPNYTVGMYNAETDEVIIQDSKSLDGCSRLKLSDTQVWMTFEEPNFFN